MVKLILSAIDYKKIFSYLIEFLITQIIKYALKKNKNYITYVEDLNKITDKFIEARGVAKSISEVTTSTNMSDEDKEKVFGNIMNTTVSSLSKLD